MATTAQSQPQVESSETQSTEISQSHSRDIVESALIGGMLLDPEGEAYDKISGIVNEHDFVDPDNKAIFRAVQKLSEDRKMIDAFTVSDWLDNSGTFRDAPAFNTVSEKLLTTAGPTNIVRWANIVREKALLRELIILGR